MKSINHPFLFLTAGICLALFLPALFMNGMFMDGTLYASVSKNYALGIGTFWNPVFSTTHYPLFHEQPPLMFLLQGIAFKVLGFGMYTERIYCLVIFFINAFFLFRCWKIIHPQGKIGWLAILFWFTMPVTFYAFINNLEENTMSVFVLAAMIHLLQALHLKQKINLNLFVAGIFILCAGMTKGVQGMFLLGTPFFWWLIFRRERFLKMTFQTSLVFIPTILFSIYAWTNPTVYESFSAYFYSRFHNSFNHFHDTSGSRFHILFELLIDSFAMIAMTLIILFSSRKKINVLSGWNNSKKLILFFSITATTGILPLMITMEQRGFYLVTALPYLAIALALFVSPSMQNLQEKVLLRKKLSAALQLFGMIIICGSIVATFILLGKPKRDAEKIAELEIIARETGDNVAFFTTTAIDSDWSFLTYAHRFHQLSFTDKNSDDLHWLLLEKTDIPPEGFQLIPLLTKNYSLYKKQ